MNEEAALYTMPTQDERANPGKAWDQVAEQRDIQNSFHGGDFKCKLCPKKVIRTED